MTPTPDALAWRKQMLGLIQVIESDQLPVPIGLGWDPRQVRLLVQVKEDGYRPWMEAIASPVLESVPHEGTTHLYATGELRRCRMVHVRMVAVAHQVGELPEVGAS